MGLLNLEISHATEREQKRRTKPFLSGTSKGLGQPYGRMPEQLQAVGEDIGIG